MQSTYVAPPVRQLAVLVVEPSRLIEPVPKKGASAWHLSSTSGESINSRVRKLVTRDRTKCAKDEIFRPTKSGDPSAQLTERGFRVEGPHHSTAKKGFWRIPAGKTISFEEGW